MCQPWLTPIASSYIIIIQKICLVVWLWQAKRWHLRQVADSVANIIIIGSSVRFVIPYLKSSSFDQDGVLTTCVRFVPVQF